LPWTGRPLGSDGLAAIKLLVMDVDGVLTRGEIAIISDGTEMRLFNSQDGVGLMVAHKAGLQTAIIMRKPVPQQGRPQAADRNARNQSS
jgi:3-deoxy-D-manno-octulosonate 8-phosphate phosphatase (KDO 8-P phosphatase)